MTFNQILIPVDLSPKDTMALDVAEDLAVRYNASVSLLHVIEDIESDEDDNETKTFIGKLNDQAICELQALGKRFEDRKIPTSGHVRLGKRFNEILAFESENAVDLIVMRSHPVDPDHLNKSVGTLSYQIAVMSTCGVLLVK